MTAKGAWLAVLVALVAVPAASAVAVEPSALQGDVERGQTLQVPFQVTETDGAPGIVLARLVMPEHNWDISVEPAQASLPAGGTHTFHVVATPPRLASPSQLGLQVEIIVITDNASTSHFVDVALQGPAGGLVLGRWENPMGEPLDGVWGTFLLNVLAWLGVATVAYALLNPGIKAVAARTRSDLDDKVVKIITYPTFVLIFAFGVKQSLESFALPMWLQRSLATAWTMLWIVIVVYVLFRLWASVILSVGKRVASKTESRLDDRLYPIFEKVGGLVILVAGMFYLLGALGIDTTFFAAGGAIVSLVVAFAAQDTLSNFFSGLHLLADQPFSEGDDIQLESGEVCRVERIGLRSTRLYHRANHEFFIVPNNQLANSRISNMLYPDKHYKMSIPVGVAYGSDVQLVKQLLLEAATRHPLVMKEADHKAWVWFMDFGQSSLDFKVYFWVQDVYMRWAVASDVREAIDAKFRQHGIEIPFPQRVVWQAKPRVGEPVAVAMPRPAHDTVAKATAHMGDDGAA